MVYCTKRDPTEGCFTEGRKEDGACGTVEQFGSVPGTQHRNAGMQECGDADMQCIYCVIEQRRRPVV